MLMSENIWNQWTNEAHESRKKAKSKKSSLHVYTIIFTPLFFSIFLTISLQGEMIKERGEGGGTL